MDAFKNQTSTSELEKLLSADVVDECDYNDLIIKCEEDVVSGITKNDDDSNLVRDIYAEINMSNPEVSGSSIYPEISGSSISGGFGGAQIKLEESVGSTEQFAEYKDFLGECGEIKYEENNDNKKQKSVILEEKFEFDEKKFSVDDEKKFKINDENQICKKRKRKKIFQDLLKSRKIPVPADSVRIALSKEKREKRDLLNYPVDVDSDLETCKVSNFTSDNIELDSSDAESIDNEQSEYFSNNTIFTEEEIVLNIRNKLLRLQNLYIKEFRKIVSNMKDKQRDYTILMKKESEVYGHLLKPANLSNKEQYKYDKMDSLARYQKVGIGPEALLFKKMIERKKAATSSIHSRSRIFNKCIFTEGGMRCSTKSVPGSKYCLKHILNDQHQVLFQACGISKGDSLCEEPVDLIFPNIGCILHNQTNLFSNKINEKQDCIPQ